MLGNLLLVLFVLLLLWLFVNLMQNGHRPARNRNASQQQNQVKRETRRQLLRLVNHDEKTMNRLLNHAKLKYPDRSEQWIWEKVIFDLKRDRRS